MALFKDMVLAMVSYDRVRKELITDSAKGGKNQAKRLRRMVNEGGQKPGAYSLTS